MKFIELVRSAISSILSRKVRSFLTSLGVIIGVFAVAALLSVGEASIKQMNSLMDDLNANIVKVQVYGENHTSLPNEIRGLQKNPNVLAAAPHASLTTPVKKGINSMYASVVGSTFEYAKIKDYKLIRGRFINALDNKTMNQSAVIGRDVALKLYGHTDVIGQTFMLKGRAFTVVGVLEKANTSMTDSDINKGVIIPIATGQKILGMDKISEFSLLAKSQSAIGGAKMAANDFMANKDITTKDYYLSSPDDVNKYMKESNKVMMALLGGIGGISLLVSGIGIMNIMLVSVRERTREIGIRKAIGAKRKDILVQFLVEAIGLSAMGGIIGIGLTFLVSSPLGALMKTTIQPSITIVAISLVFSVIVGIVFGVYPAIKASTLRPVEALHYE